MKGGEKSSKAPAGAAAPRADSRDTDTKKSPTALREEEVLAFWQERNIFEKTLQKPAPKGTFSFYDGPPFATGLPHYGSLLSSIIKDVIPRYKTMRGYRVPRRWGWDCHGLPIEHLIEKELGLKTKKDVLAYGIAAFNEACRASVLRFADEWEQYVARVGRWVDFHGSYKTMDNDYMESVWWALKRAHEKGYLYEGRKVLLYCTRCETPLAKAEIAMDNSYQEVTEEAVYVAFPLRAAGGKFPEGTALLAWTTTPWTLPGNVALAVHPDLEYALVRDRTGERYYLLAHARAADVVPDGEVVEVVKGKKLVGLSYEPLYRIPAVEAEKKKRAHTVLPASFVTAEEGTGVVHTAVIYGEDDYALGQEYNLPMVPLLDEGGRFHDAAPEFLRGGYFKDAEEKIKEDLSARGLLYRAHDHTHSYPHCYRCGTPLIYNAITSWFLDIQRIKKKMRATNEHIQWFPPHLKHGRYRHILEHAPDWTISRNRFWAAPLPVWRNEKTGKHVVIGSLEELKAYTKKSGNTYLLMRHGEAESNARGFISTEPDDPNPLTEVGREQVARAAEALRAQHGVDLIITSPFVRTKESAAIVARVFPEAKVVEDARLGEIRLGALHGEAVARYREQFPTYEDRWARAPEGGETLRDVYLRAAEFLYEIERTYQDKTILIITHEYPAWALVAAAQGADKEAFLACRNEGEDFIQNAEVRPLPFVPLPHRADYALDLHRPYIDEVALVDEDGAPLVRVPEVIDCWVESGSMPFAQWHYPFAHEKEFKDSFPADFIAEYIAQTRTWFYYMHAMGVMLFKQEPFTNVVTTGTILAGDGSKMSKSKKNYTDPMENLYRFGADALRYYLMSSPIMQAEDIRFRDEEVREAHNRVVNLLWNTYQFYALFRHHFHEGVDPYESAHVLDQWILARLSALAAEVTAHMDRYDMVRATRPLRDFVEDLSTWYVRRSRARFRLPAREEDRAFALATLRFVLREFSKIIAPVMPFIAESVYRGVGGEEESVHLETWPELPPADEAVLGAMLDVRHAVTLALKARAEAGIKVRQPLARLTIKNARLKGMDDFLALVRDEVNVKEVVCDPKAEEEAVLDTTLTPALREEGAVRELTRHIQHLRKQKGLQPEDRVRLLVHAGPEGRALVQRHREALHKAAGVAAVEEAPHKGEAHIPWEGEELSFSIEEL